MCSKCKLFVSGDWIALARPLAMSAALVAGSRVLFVARVGARPAVIGGVVLKVREGSTTAHVAVPDSVTEEEEAVLACGDIRFTVMRVGTSGLHPDSPQTRAQLTAQVEPGTLPLFLAQVNTVSMITAYERSLATDYTLDASGAEETAASAAAQPAQTSPLSASTGSFHLVPPNVPATGSDSVGAQLQAITGLLTSMRDDQASLRARMEHLEQQAQVTGRPNAGFPPPPGPLCQSGPAAQAASLLEASGLWQQSGAASSQGPPAAAPAGASVATGQPGQAAVYGSTPLVPGPAMHAMDSDSESSGADLSDGDEQSAPPLIADYLGKKRNRRSKARQLQWSLTQGGTSTMDPNLLVQYEMVKVLRSMKRHSKGRSDVDSSGSDKGYMGSMAGGIAGLHRSRRAFRRRPLKSVWRYRLRVMRRLGVSTLASGQCSAPWAYTDHSLKIRAHFGRMTGLWRVHYALSKLLALGEAKEFDLMTGSLVQLLKAVHQTALDGGNWSNAILLIPWPDPLARDLWAGEDDEMAMAAKFSRSVKDLSLRVHLPENATPAVPSAEDLAEHHPEGGRPTRAQRRAGGKGGKGKGEKDQAHGGEER